jgi:hypothetical protein
MRGNDRDTRLIYHDADECTVALGWRTWFFKRWRGRWIRVDDQDRKHKDQRIPEGVRDVLPERTQHGTHARRKG